MITDLSRQIKLYCKRCDRAWVYKGKAIYYTCCPICHNNINIRKGKIL